MTSISGEQLFEAFNSGSEALIAERETLNKMNVFPVSDGDTGSNLSYTLKSMIENTEISPDARHTLKSLARSALIGARGNSGILFAQFVNGMAEKVGPSESLTVEQFAEQVNHAVSRAYQAISNPVEGTMLTVMREWATAVKDALAHIRDFPGVMKHSLARAKTSLAETKDKLEALKKAGVQDAGARGFVDFLRGFLEFFEKGAKVTSVSGKRLVSLEGTSDEDIHADITTIDDIGHRYCTEGIVSGAEIPAEAVRAALEGLGDSFIVAGGGSDVRIHIHTDDPGEVFYRLKQFGRVSNQKVDDMNRQFQVMKKRRHATAILVDSTCDLPLELLDEHQIHMVPLTIHFGENDFLDRFSIGTEQFFRLLDEDTSFPTTSQPSPSLFARAYSHLTTHYENVIAIHISGNLSGTLQTSRTEAAKFAGRIRTVDSKSASSCFGLIALETARALDAGTGFEEAADLATKLSDRIETWVTTPKMDNFIRGGRVSKLKGGIGKLLGICPIISMNHDGRTYFYDKAFGYRKALQKIVVAVAKRHAERRIRTFAITHADAATDAAEMAAQIRAITGTDPEFIGPIAPVIGAHSGRGAVNVSVLYEE